MDPTSYLAGAVGPITPSVYRAVAIWIVRTELLSSLWNWKSGSPAGQLHVALEMAESLSRLADKIWTPGRALASSLRPPINEMACVSHYLAGHRVREIAFLVAYPQTEVVRVLTDVGFPQPWRAWSERDQEALEAPEFLNRTIQECSEALRRSPWDVAYRFCETMDPSPRESVGEVARLWQLPQEDPQREAVRDARAALNQIGVPTPIQDQIIQQAAKSGAIARELGILEASVPAMDTAARFEQRRQAAVVVCALDRLATYMATFGIAVGGSGEQLAMRELKNLARQLAESFQLYSPAEVKFFRISEIWESVTQFPVPYEWLADNQIDLVQLAAFSDRDLRRELGKLRQVADISWRLWLHALRSSETVRQPSPGRRSTTQSRTDASDGDSSHKPMQTPTSQEERATPKNDVRASSRHRADGSSDIHITMGELKVATIEGRTVIVSPFGEILMQIPKGSTTGMEWFLREATKRHNYPRHGEHWTEEEDRLLSERFVSGLTVKELTRWHQRSPGGIRSRLVKLGLKD